MTPQERTIHGAPLPAVANPEKRNGTKTVFLCLSGVLALMASVAVFALASFTATRHTPISPMVSQRQSVQPAPETPYDPIVYHRADGTAVRYSQTSPSERQMLGINGLTFRPDEHKSMFDGSDSGTGGTFVHDYYRADGTLVRGHVRSAQ